MFMEWSFPFAARGQQKTDGTKGRKSGKRGSCVPFLFVAIWMEHVSINHQKQPAKQKKTERDKIGWLMMS